MVFFVLAQSIYKLFPSVNLDLTIQLIQKVLPIDADGLRSIDS
jgi:hypothetical protein